MELFLIRHTRVVADGICYGRNDVPLASSFDDEVRHLKDVLPSCFSRIYSSPVKRCVTLSEALGYGNAIVDNRLSEFFYGDWEGKRWDDIPKEAFDEWTTDLVNGCPPNGESLADMFLRISSFFDDLKTEQLERALIITHAGVIRCAKAYMENVPLTDIFNINIGFGEVCRYIL